MEYIKTKNSLDSKLQNDSIYSFRFLNFLEVNVVLKNGKMLNPELNIKKLSRAFMWMPDKLLGSACILPRNGSHFL